MRILAMVGTQIHDFSRMLKDLEKISDKYDIIAQVGHSNFCTEKFETFKFCSYDELQDLKDKADIIVTHGGAGSMIESINLLKPVIVYNRLLKFKEHINDHQLELSGKLKELGYLIVVDEKTDIKQALDSIKDMKLRAFDEKGNIPEIISKHIEDWM